MIAAPRLELAITGGVAEGKSTVLEMFRTAGWRVGSSDQLAADLRRKPDIQEAIAKLIGSVSPVSDSELRERLFSEPDLRRRVNQLLHRSVWEEMSIQDAEVWEVPLLVEAVLTNRFRRVIVVTCGPEIQRQRLMERHRDETLVDRILGSQLPTKTKVPFADAVIRTDCERDHVLKHVAEISHAFRYR